MVPLQHGHEMDITKGFEYLMEEEPDCETKLLTTAQLQESPFTDLARYVAKQRQVSTELLPSSFFPFNN